jgi:hypothetical protein
MAGAAQGAGLVDLHLVGARALAGAAAEPVVQGTLDTDHIVDPPPGHQRDDPLIERDAGDAVGLLVARVAGWPTDRHAPGRDLVAARERSAARRPRDTPDQPHLVAMHLFPLSLAVTGTFFDPATTPGR